MPLLDRIKQWNHLRKTARHPRKIYILPESFGYIPIRKCATRAMYKLLDEHFYQCDLESGVISPDHPLEDYREVYKNRASGDALERLCRNQFTFSIVRHPLSRIYSAYKNKVLLSADKKETMFAKYGIKPNISFESFIEIIDTVPNDVIDRHLRPQSWFLSNGGKLLPIKIIRMESMADDWQEVYKNCGLPFPGKINETFKSNHPILDKNYEKIFMKKYSQDYNLLNYN